MPRPSGRVSTGYLAFQIHKSALPSVPTHTSPVACCGKRVDHSVPIFQPNSSPISCMQTGLCRMRTESLAVALTARRETDFGRQRLGCQNRRYLHLSVRERPQARYLNRGNARKLRAIRQRPGNAGFASNCVVVDAAPIEPVSAANSLLTGKRTGNFCQCGLRGRFSCLIQEHLQKLAAKFPTQRNRESLRA